MTAPSLDRRPWHQRSLGGLLPFGGALLACGVLLAVSRVTAPALDELAGLASVDRAAELVRRVASSGIGQLAEADARASLAEVRGPPFVLLGAWCKLALAERGLLDAISAARLPWLLLAASAPVALYSLLAPSRGRWVGALGAALLLLTPRWLHGAVVATEGVVVSSFWLLVLATAWRSYGRARDHDPAPPSPRRRVCYALSAAVLLGVGASVSFATLAVVPLLIAHFAVTRSGATRRLLGRALMPVPPLILPALLVTPAVLFACSPGLWRSTPALIARRLLAPLGPTVARAELGGRVFDRLPVPGGYATSWLWQSTPLWLWVAALAGVLAVAHELLARRFASGRLRPERDRHLIGVLAVLGLGAALLWPAVSPDLLTLYPPRVELAVPFLVLLGALGLAALARQVRPTRLAWVPPGVVVLALAASSLSSPATLGASFNGLLGGPRRVARTRALPLGDGSELGPLAAAIDRVGAAELSVRAPEVPAELWSLLRQAGRMRTRVGPAGREVVVTKGQPRGGRVLAQVRRQGAVLWSLSEP